MRKAIIAGNWKMHDTIGESAELAKALAKAVKAVDDREVVIAPVFTALPAVTAAVQGSAVRVAAQNMHWEEKGAYTGEISPVMVKDLAVTYVILGHSERRQYFAETNETINKKVKSAVAHGIVPIVCCGETLAQREAGQAESFIAQQIREALAGVEAKDAAALVIAYEPIWAIGTGKTATSEQAEEICQLIRQTILDMYNGPVADAIRVLYGGSVKGSNVNELMAKKNIDGALVGGASLKADSFMEIVNFVRV